MEVAGRVWLVEEAGVVAGHVPNVAMPLPERLGEDDFPGSWKLILTNLVGTSPQST